MQVYAARPVILILPYSMEKTSGAKFQIHVCMNYNSSVLNIECICFLMLGAKDVVAYWSDRTFDSFPVIPTPMSSVNC